MTSTHVLNLLKLFGERNNTSLAYFFSSYCSMLNFYTHYSNNLNSTVENTHHV